jgi:hypothetical protein
MSSQDYIPHKEPQFNIWQAILIAAVEANATLWGVPAESITKIKALQAAWVAAYAKASNRKERSTTEVHAKDDAMEAFKKGIRKLVSEYLAFNSKVSDTDRKSMGLTIRTGQRTSSPVPETYPIAYIDISTPLQHAIHLTDSGSNERGKPAGVHGCEIWVKVGGEEPKTGSEYTFLALDTKSPYVANYDLADVGKQVWYRFRWVNKLGQPGPWSHPYGTVIGG